jgi:hypothetical protein
MKQSNDHLLSDTALAKKDGDMMLDTRQYNLPFGVDCCTDGM